MPPAAKRPRKRRRRRRSGTGAVAEGPDCFTHLNDDLLRAIISRLPVRSVVALASASRNFRAQVPSLLDRVDSLTLYEPHFPTPLRDAPPLLLRRLVVTPHAAIPPSTFGPIINNAVQHGVSEIVFRLTRRARIPKNLLSVRSLAVLTLDKCAVPHWSKVKCPCLRTLRLRCVAIHQNTFKQILVSASSLVTLEMDYCPGLGTGVGGGCTLESSSVRNLFFRPPLKQGEVVIKASGLRTASLYARVKTRKLEVAPAPEIRKAYLHVEKPRRPIESFSVRPFLDAGTRLAHLTLRGHAMKYLSMEYADIPKLTVMFQELKTLSTTLDLSSRELVFLLKLLESCPALEQFTISSVKSDEDKEKKQDKDEDEGMSAKSDGDDDEDMAPAAEEDKAPPCFTDHEQRLRNISCLTTSLVEFRFIGFKPEEYQKRLMVFLLTQAKNLKKVGVEFDKSQADAVKEIMSVRSAPVQTTSTRYKNGYLELDYS